MWARFQIYIGIIGYLFFGWCWMKGKTVDDNGQDLFGFVIMWTFYFILRAILTAYRYNKYKDLLQRLVFKEALKLKIK
jgi:hypothetical protein